MDSSFISKLLATLRKRSGLPYDLLSREIGLDPTTIWNLRHKKIKVRPIHIEKIQSFLDRCENLFKEGTDGPTEAI